MDRPESVPRALRIYDRLILSRPALSLLVLAVLCSFFFYGIKDFRVDASGDTLVLEHDEDVKYNRAVSARYESGDFVFIAYSPPEDLFAPASLERLKKVREEIKRLPNVTSVVTLLDVPLLRNPPGTLKDLKRNVKTLESRGVSLKHAVAEFRDSPIYQNLLVGEDLKATAIQVNFKVDDEDQAMVARRGLLREKEYHQKISPEEKLELGVLERRYRAYKDEVRSERRADIAALRAIIARYQGQAKFFLGGVPMIIEDIMTYVRNDIVFFGLGMLLFVMITLYLIYRRKRWVILPLLTCLTATLVMMGGMGFYHWDVTVVSSNFSSLQIILTMSLSIHIVSRYRELLRERPEADNRDLVRDTVRDTFVPCLYTNLATIAGFESLVFCDIRPVVQFGWIMTLGLIVSMIIVYWLLPAAMALLGKYAAEQETEMGAPVTFYFATFTHRRMNLIYCVTLIVILATAAGITRLQVENSFISYFRARTEIHQGMKFIDEKLGGTTPLDVIVKLGPDKPAAKAAAPAAADADFAAFDEFEEKERDPSKYWYTASRIGVIEKAHDYLDKLPETGKVLSLATLHKTAKTFNEGKPLDDFGLAVLYNVMSEKFRGFLITPYVSIEQNEARITLRVKDSMPELHRAELIERIRAGLVSEVGLKEDQFRITGLMLLYNNMLQSLYGSQIKTIATSMGALLVMFVVLFRSLKIAVVALAPQALSCLSILGIMGLGGIPLDVMTITIVSVAMGIGVEDAIQYVYRFRTEIAKDQDYVRTMHHCHMTIGNAMFYTSLAVTAGFSILAFSNFVPTILFGLLTGVAMVVACVASQTLLPALLLLTKPFGPAKRVAVRALAAGAPALDQA